MGREYTRLYRLLRLIGTIQSKRGLSAGDLARLCEVHERTIYRDMETLNASGFPCGFDPETNGIRIKAGFFMPPIELTFEEAMAIVAVTEEVAGSGQVPFFRSAGRAVEKIRSQLPVAVLEAMEPLDNRVRIDLPPTMADESCRDVYDEILSAIANKRALICTYDAPASSLSNTAEKEAEFDFRPYALWYCQRAFYAVGLHGGRGEIRRLKLNRFTSVIPTDRPYHIPDNFDPRHDLGLAWRMIRGDQRHRVVVRFEPDFSDNASETRWHSTQEEQWDDDGRVTLTFTVDGLEEIVWWVLGYGPGATELEPPELIERVRELARATANRYG
jgi:predicted DNA-binding transcriptional regulator YafY